MRSQKKGSMQMRFAAVMALGLFSVASASGQQANRNITQNSAAWKLTGMTPGIFVELPAGVPATASTDARQSAPSGGRSTKGGGEQRLYEPGQTQSQASQSARFTTRVAGPAADSREPDVRSTTANRFSYERDQTLQRRPPSAFPEKASPTMFPGSRLRGPFEQTYPRPFYAGGQP